MTDTQQLPRYRLEYYDHTDILPMGFDESDDIQELIRRGNEAWNEQPRAVTSLVLVEVLGPDLFEDNEPVRVWLDEEPGADWPEPEWPEAVDTGRRVELLLDDGSTVVGRLEPGDARPDRNREIPLWRVKTDATATYWLDSAAAWRWVGF